MKCRNCKHELKKVKNINKKVAIVFLNTEHYKEDENIKEHYRCSNPRCGMTFTLKGNYFYFKEMLDK